METGDLACEASEEDGRSTLADAPELDGRNRAAANRAVSNVKTNRVTRPRCCAVTQHGSGIETILYGVVRFVVANSARGWPDYGG